MKFSDFFFPRVRKFPFQDIPLTILFTFHISENNKYTHLKEKKEKQMVKSTNHFFKPFFHFSKKYFHSYCNVTSLIWHHYEYE